MSVMFPAKVSKFVACGPWRVAHGLWPMRQISRAQSAMAGRLGTCYGKLLYIPLWKKRSWNNKHTGLSQQTDGPCRVKSKPDGVRCTMTRVRRTMARVRRTMARMRCTMARVWCTMARAQCTMDVAFRWALNLKCPLGVATTSL